MVVSGLKSWTDLCINLNHRLHPARIVKQWQNEGQWSLTIYKYGTVDRRFEYIDTEYYHLKALNPHSVDIMRYFGEMWILFCLQLRHLTEIWSTASINMKFKNGAVGHLTSSYDIAQGHPMERCEVAGTRDVIFEDMWREAILYPTGSLVKQVCPILFWRIP